MELRPQGMGVQGMIEYLCHFIGSRYQWGAEGPYNVGFDCSGFILEGLRMVGWWGRNDAGAQGIYDHFSAAHGDTPLAGVNYGCLVFFGKSTKEISHIGLAITPTHYIEAGGGDSHTVDKGMVRIRPITWRKDLVGVIQL